MWYSDSLFPLTLLLYSCQKVLNMWWVLPHRQAEIAPEALFLLFGLKLISENSKIKSPLGNHKTCFNIVKPLTVFTNSHLQELFCLLRMLLAFKLCSLWCTLFNPFWYVVEYFFLTCYPVLEGKTFFSDIVAFR